MNRVYLQSNLFCAVSHAYRLYYIAAITRLFIHDGVNLFAIHAPRLVIIGNERKPPEWVHKIKIERAAMLGKRNMCCENRSPSFLSFPSVL